MTGKASALAFGAAQLLMFGSVSLLQIAPVQFFVPLLLVMHAGILWFMKLRRRLPADPAEVARITRATYVLMGMYLPILVYKLLAGLGLLRMQYPVLHGATLSLAVLAALLVVRSLRAIRLCANG
ncbi:MAG TPA: hypothetical protein ENN96_02680 [Candidatus Acetothermia bacterium]|nr:hypothetical protein [Candidatus Acetothermia bacterium]